MAPKGYQKPRSTPPTRLGKKAESSFEKRKVFPNQLCEYNYRVRSLHLLKIIVWNVVTREYKCIKKYCLGPFSLVYTRAGLRRCSHQRFVHIIQSVPILILNLSIVLFLIVSDYYIIASKLTILIALLLFSFTFIRSHSYCNKTDTALRSLLMRWSVLYRNLVPYESWVSITGVYTSSRMNNYGSNGLCTY